MAAGGASHLIRTSWERMDMLDVPVARNDEMSVIGRKGRRTDEKRILMLWLNDVPRVTMKTLCHQSQPSRWGSRTSKKVSRRTYMKPPVQTRRENVYCTWTLIFCCSSSPSSPLPIQLLHRRITRNCTTQCTCLPNSYDSWPARSTHRRSPPRSTAPSRPGASP